MSTMVIVVFLASLANASPPPFLKDIDCQQGDIEPTVTVANSSYLKVAWVGVFELYGGCKGRKVKVTLDDQVNLVQMEKMSIALPADVCLKHNITVTLENGDPKHGHRIVYNENTQRYGGLLEDVKHEICTKVHNENDFVVSLNIPKEIQHCIRSGHDAKVKKAKQFWKPNIIQVELINPEDENKTMTIDIPLIPPYTKSIPEVCECKPSELLSEVEAEDETHLSISWNNTFPGKCREIIESVTLTLNDKNTTRDFEDLSVSLYSDACENQNLSATLNMKDASKVVMNKVYTVKNDSDFCHRVAGPLVLALAFLIPLAITLVVVLTVALLCIRRDTIRFTPIKVHHVPDATHLPSPWSRQSEAETESSNESQQSSAIICQPPSLRFEDAFLTPSADAKVETELLVGLSGSTIKKTTMKRPKKDGIKSVDITCKWQLTNATSDGEEEQLTILEGGGRSNQASPDPRRNKQHASQRNQPSPDDPRRSNQQASQRDQASPHPRRNSGRFAPDTDDPDFCQDRLENDLAPGASTDKILVMHTNPEQTESSIYLK